MRGTLLPPWSDLTGESPRARPGEHWLTRSHSADYQGRQLRVRQDKTQSGPIPALTPTERAVPPLFPETATVGGGEEGKSTGEAGRVDAVPMNGAGRGSGTGLAGKRGNLPPLRLGPAPGGAYAAFGNGGHSGRLMMPSEGGNTAGRGMAPMTPSVSRVARGRGDVC